MDSHVNGSNTLQVLQLWSWLSPIGRKGKLISQRVCISVKMNGSLSQGGRGPIIINLLSRSWLVSSRDDAILRAQIWTLLLADWNLAKAITRLALVNGIHKVWLMHSLHTCYLKAYSVHVPSVPVLEWLISTDWVTQTTWLFSCLFYVGCSLTGIDKQ